MKCPICEGESPPALTKAGFQYRRCARCEFLFYRPEPGRNGGGGGDGEVFAYDERYWATERAEAARRERQDCVLRALELIYLSSRPVQNVLDFGCGLGATVESLRQATGLNVVGVDKFGEFQPSDHLHRVDLDDLFKKYPRHYFDAIYSVEVFEHLDDPRRVMASLSSFLKPGGLILINTGTEEWMANDDPDMDYVDPVVRGHISIYSLKSLEALAAPVGLRARFLGARRYMALLGEPGQEDAPAPLPENLRALERVGEWFPMMLGEYMRLVWLEEEFDKRGRWAQSLSDALEEMRQKAVT